MKKEDVDKAVDLKKEIEELNYFMETIDPSKNVKRGSGSHDITMVLKKQTTTTYSIFGCRWIGAGHHCSEIQIPNSMLNKIYELAVLRMGELEQELSGL